MSITVVNIKLEDWDATDIHCPACGAGVSRIDSGLEPCEHVDFVSFPMGDLEYIRKELEPVVEEWREVAERRDREFVLADVLSRKLEGATSFIFAITWEGLFDALWIGFTLGHIEPDEDSEDDDESSIEAADGATGIVDSRPKLKPRMPQVSAAKAPRKRVESRD
ncbi:hypothetical protein [Paludibaculum fermentans]|uniref:Uncharacterized protein n=1 Tax=Paludibaculum fermentans TaxID=1473598 RepID=A0A7S7SJN0_PALFE|nr:hypothetical protein [Paludibaculum fermentans]QOY86155.1 hypothetical protein IRI77_25540 [Paludibaculum fermentans]